MPNLSQIKYAPQKNFVLPPYSIPQKKSGFLNKALRPRSLRSLAPPMAFSRWRRVGLLGKTLVRHRFAYQSLLIKKHLNRKQVNKLDLMIPQVKKFMDLLASVNG